jgi:hypothetical protein
MRETRSTTPADRCPAALLSSTWLPALVPFCQEKGQAPGDSCSQKDPIPLNSEPSGHILTIDSTGYCYSSRFDSPILNPEKPPHKRAVGRWIGLERGRWTAPLKPIDSGRLVGNPPSAPMTKKRASLRDKLHQMWHAHDLARHSSAGHDEKTFRSLLGTECMRSARSRLGFQILLCCLSVPNRTLLMMKTNVETRIVLALKGTLRESDHIGWFREGLILGAVLTAVRTSEGQETSQHVGTRISQQFQSPPFLDHSSSAPLQIYHYRQLPEQMVAERQAIDQIPPRED